MGYELVEQYLSFIIKNILCLEQHHAIKNSLQLAPVRVRQTSKLGQDRLMSHGIFLSTTQHFDGGTSQLY